MVVSERYACFWSLFNLRFSLYSAQFMMLTLFKFTSFTFTTNLDFSLLFNPHLLWFLYLFSVVLFFPSLPISVRGQVHFCLTCKGRVVLSSDSDSVQENWRHEALCSLKMWKWIWEDSDEGGTRVIETLVGIPTAPTGRHGSHAELPARSPLLSPCMSACWLDSGVPTETPGQPHSEGKESSVWRAGLGADSVLLWRELAWLLRFPLPCFYFPSWE